ncbi:MAG: M50 family metallopeptidase, partial [Myxococcota bacterium]|nr:M50 family metallopeptidase [Myxococcota bacterium]
MNDRKTVLIAFWVAVAISFLLHGFQPWGRYILYPFAMLSTWAHEMGHGIAAILTGGTFSHLYLYQNLGGTAYCAAGSPFLQPIVSIGGLLGPSICGGIIIAQSARSTFRSQLILILLTVLMIVSWVIWVRNVFGFFAVGGICIFLCALAFGAPKNVQVASVQLIGIQLCLG